MFNPFKGAETPPTPTPDEKEFKENIEKPEENFGKKIDEYLDNKEIKEFKENIEKSTPEGDGEIPE
jgi:hypothetical protein